MPTTGGEELDELRAGLRRALEREAPLRATAARMEEPGAWDLAAWNVLSDTLALPALGVDEQYGGQGFGLVEQEVALEETGRVLYPGPYLAGAVLAGGALALTGDRDALADVLPGLAAGTTTATLALTDAAGTTTTAQGPEDTVSLDGDKVAVIAGADADLLVVAALRDREPVLVVVERRAPGVEATPVISLDLTRRLATVALRGAPGRVLRSGRPGRDLLAALEVHRVAALAAEAAGVAQAALETTVAYAGTRVQFGREIGSYQAVRHRLADLHGEVALATASARAAARDLALDPFGRAAAITALTAASLAAEIAPRVAKDTIQLHGGIGFTWEHPAHLFLKRAKSTELLLGGPEALRRRLGDLLTAPPCAPGEPS